MGEEKLQGTGYDREAELLNSFRTGENGPLMVKHQMATMHSDFSMNIV